MEGDPRWVLVSFFCPPGAHSLVGRQTLKMRREAAQMRTSAGDCGCIPRVTFELGAWCWRPGVPRGLDHQAGGWRAKRDIGKEHRDSRAGGVFCGLERRMHASVRLFRSLRCPSVPVLWGSEEECWGETGLPSVVQSLCVKHEPPLASLVGWRVSCTFSLRSQLSVLPFLQYEPQCLEARDQMPEFCSRGFPLGSFSRLFLFSLLALYHQD